MKKIVVLFALLALAGCGEKAALIVTIDNQPITHKLEKLPAQINISSGPVTVNSDYDMTVSFCDNRGKNCGNVRIFPAGRPAILEGKKTKVYLVSLEVGQWKWSKIQYKEVMIKVGNL